MMSSRKSTSAKVEPEDRGNVLDFGKLQKMLTNRRQASKDKGLDNGRSSDSPDSSSASQRAQQKIEAKRLPPRACRMTAWTTAGPRRSNEVQESRSPRKSPRKSPKKSKSAEKGTSPLKVEPIPFNKDAFEVPTYAGPPVFLVKRQPKRDEPEVGQPIRLDGMRRRRRTKRDRSPVFPPVSTKHFKPLCVIQRLPEPHDQIDELTRLLVSAITEIKTLQEAVKEKRDTEAIESVLARGLMATNNKPIFKKVLRWTMKNCRTEMVKKIEKKLGLKLKRKTRAQLENEVPEEMPAIPKPSQIKKPTFKKPEDDEVNEALFPNLMVNRVLLGLSKADGNDSIEEAAD